MNSKHPLCLPLVIIKAYKGILVLSFRHLDKKRKCNVNITNQYLKYIYYVLMIDVRSI